MNENATTQASTVATSSPTTTRSVTRSTSRVTVNFVLPEGVDPNTITLDNYRKVTGKRFRKTKDQEVVRGLTREEAFVESKALAVSQLGDK
jgi:hypothetical protein